MGTAGAAEDHEAAPLRHADDLGRESGLADPCFPRQTDDLPLAGQAPLQERPDPGDLSGSTDQLLAGDGPRRPGRQPFTDGVDRPDADPPCLALHLDRLEPVQDDRPTHPLVGRVVDEELAGHCRLHEARGQVHRVADHGVLPPEGRTDRTAVDGATGDSGSGRAAEHLEQFQTTPDRTFLVVLVTDRRTEEDDQQAASVAGGHLPEVSAVAVDHLHGDGHVPLQRRHRRGLVVGRSRQFHEGGGHRAVLVDELVPPGAQPFGDDGVEEGDQPLRHVLADGPGRTRPDRPGAGAQTPDDAPSTPVLSYLHGGIVLEESAIEDDLAAVRLVFGRDRPTEGRTGEHGLQADRRIPDDRERHGSGTQTRLHPQSEGPGAGDDGAEPPDCLLHVQRAPDRPARRSPSAVTLVVEHRDQCVTGELHQSAAVARDTVGHLAEPTVQDPGELLGAEAADPGQCLAHRGEAHHVGEQHHRIGRVGSGEGQVLPVREQGPNHVLGDERTPHRAHGRIIAEIVDQDRVISHQCPLCRYRQSCTVPRLHTRR